MRLSLALVSCASLLFASGCDVYFGGGDGDDDCDFGGGGFDRVPDPLPGADDYLRNPDSGTCEYFGGGGGGGGGWCDDPCAPCDQPTEPGGGAPAPFPTWGSCSSFCEGLDEASCYATDGCRAAFAGDNYYGCWATDTTGPIRGGGCDELDAYSCSLHDDCVAVHAASPCGVGAEADEAAEPCPDIGWFEFCRAEEGTETGCYGDADCGEGQRCNAAEVCLPPPGCEDPAGDSDPGLGECDAVCYGMCVPDDPTDPGSCTGEVACDAEPPACPPNSIAGRKDGCWTGYCIPVEACDDPPPPPPVCSDIGDEMTCIGEGCTPLYVGEDCTCGPDGCACDWKFLECR